MSKFSFSRISSLINAPTTINGIIAQIEAAFDTLLSRDGASPNQMTSSLDMNSNRIINLPYPTSGQDPVRRQDLQTLITNVALNNSGLVWVWQIKKVLSNMAVIDTVESAVSPISTDGINIFWTEGGLTTAGDSLSNFIKSTLSWSDSQITNLYTTAKSQIR